VQADVNLAAEGNITPLWIAAHEGHRGAVEALARHGGDIEARESVHGASPVFIAAENGRVDALRALLELKAECREPKEDGTTPLFIAAQGGHRHACTLLCEFNADVNQPGALLLLLLFPAPGPAHARPIVRS
jgi:ankyrin repeat protein